MPTNIDKLTDAVLTDDTQIQVYEDPSLGISTERKTTVGSLKDFIVRGYIQPRTATDAELNDVTDSVNTDAGKVQGSMVYNSTTDNPVYSTGSLDASIWVDGAGTTVNTPV